MIRGRDVYITIDWYEQGPMDDNNSRFNLEGREIYTRDYPETLPCHNPDCTNGGFEIGSRISALLDSGGDHEQNSLVCRNAVHPDKTQSCLHTISYSIACIYPHGQRRVRAG